MSANFINAWAEVVKNFGSKNALTGFGSSKTYAQLDEEARSIAAWLTKNNVQNRCVAIMLENPVDSIVSMIGVLLSGNYYFYLGHKLELASSFRTFIELGAIIRTKNISSLGQVPELIWENKITDEEVKLTSLVASPYFAVYMTSGTTSTPKLVRYRQDFILQESRLVAEIMEIESNDKRDYAGSLFFSASLGAIFPTLLSGAELIIHDTAGTNFYDLPRFWSDLGITFTTVPVSVLRVLAKSILPLDPFLNRLRLLVITAEAASIEDMRLFADRLPKHIQLMNGYATTETRSISFIKHSLDNLDFSTIGSVGKPVKGKMVLVVDQKGAELPAGETGEIVVESEALPDRYINQIEQNNFEYGHYQKIRFKTGDRGYLDERGFLFLVGRTDDIVKINGIKVDLLEIEKSILSHPEVTEAAVVFHPETQRVQAWFKGADQLTVSQIRQWVRTALPTAPLPNGWMKTNQFPKTATGKIDRTKLREIHIDEVEPKTANANDLNNMIIHIWKKELQIHQEIHPDDDFFLDLGGNSLTAAVCVHELEKYLGFELPAGIGNTYSTPRLLARYVGELQERPAHSLLLNDYNPSRPSLYFIPPYPGDRRTYFDLERRLSDHYNLYFLFYRPVDTTGKIVPLAHLIDAMADQIQNHPSNQLFGYSFGGILSYLLAMKLEEKEINVDNLILLDTPLYEKLSRWEQMRNFLIRLARKGKLFASSPLTFWTQYVKNFRSVYREYRQNFTEVKQSVDPSHPSRVIWEYTQSFPTFRKINATILLYLASEKGAEHTFKQDFSWQRYSNHTVQTVPLKGWHVELLASEDNLDRIAQSLMTLETSYQKKLT